jgi:hypothetical protein
MKFRFEAIDGQGTVLRRVLRADDEASAREALLAEGIFPKRMEPVDEDEKISWTPRTGARELQERVKSHREGTSGTEPEVRERMPAVLRRGNTSTRGSLIIRSDNSVLFEGGDQRVVMQREQVETARLAGFPVRVLRIAMLDGELLEFGAGFLFAGGFHRRVRDLLAPRK